MNKLTKAAIAGGAGIILLMGGAGTFAVWNDSAVAGNVDITAGNLEIVSNGAGTWTDQDGSIDISSYRIVPGDTLTYTASFQVTAVGDNLTAQAALGALSILPSTSADADVKLAALLTKSAAFKINDIVTDIVSAEDGTPQEVTVSVTIRWPGDGADADDIAAMLGSVNLDEFDVTLTQTLP